MTQSTAERVLAALSRCDLKDEGNGKYRSNSPLRPGSNSHAFTLLISGPEHGCYHDKVSGDEGSLYKLAAALGVERARRARPDPRELIAAYDYTDAEGQLLYQVCRYEPGKEGRAKDFVQRRPDGKGGWKWDMQGVERVLYNLPEVRHAVSAGETIYLVEGEKDANRLRLYGLVATTNVGGAGKGKWLPTYNKALVGAHIVVLRDNDEPGMRHRDEVVRHLLPVAASVKAPDLPGLPPKGDVSDWLDAGHTLRELQVLVAEAQAEGPPTQPAQSAQTSGETPRPRSDTGNAELLADLYGQELRYDHAQDRWLVWDGARWTADSTGEPRRAAIAVVRHRYEAATRIESLDERKREAAWAIASESSGRLEGMLRVAQILSPFATAIEAYDADALFAATPGGVTIDLRTGTARAAARGDLLTMALGTCYDAGATCPRWRSFLEEVFAGDHELIDYVQRAIGYTLTGETSEQVLFLCYGGGANGKSVFLDVLALLMGDYAANVSFDTFDASRRSENTYDLASLKGKRYVSVIETSEDRRLNEARVKSVTGQDVITARHPYGRPFHYRPAWKIWMAMNHLPRVTGTDRGIWRRLRLIPFEQTFEGREDRTLRETLRAELPGILNWALEGLRAWRAEGLSTCRKVAAAVEQYRADSDQVGRWLDECTEASDEVTVPIAAAYASYKDWCKVAGEYPLSQNLWGRRLSERNITRKRTSGRGWLFCGIALLTGWGELGTATSDSDPMIQMIQNPSTSPQENSSRGEFLGNRSFGSLDHASSEDDDRTTLPKGWRLRRCDYRGNLSPVHGTHWYAEGPCGEHTDVFDNLDSASFWAWRQ